MILFILLVLFILLLEYGSSWSHAANDLSQRTSQILDALIQSTGFIFDIAYFVSAHILLQSILIILSLYLGRAFFSKISKTVSVWVWACMFYVLFKLYIYYINTLSYPRSRMTLEIPAYLKMDEVVTAVHVSFTLVIFFAIFILVKHWLSFGKVPKRYLLCGVLPMSLILASATGCFPKDIFSLRDFKGKEGGRKNVILIGIDSNSWRHIDSNLNQLPNISRIIANGYSWTNVVTPVARTYPAWNSVLTGEYPAKHHALYNLVSTELVLKENLAYYLQSKGYRTIYAQDERRFNNIDKSFGFDQTVGPKVGAADFILPLFSDHPMSNVTYQFPLGQILFPYLALNRAADLTYIPSTFVAAIAREVEGLSAPVFLATHFCLAHFPYTWAMSTDAAIDLPQKHILALRQVDRQIGSLLDALEENGILDNALLVLFSDHGESINGGANQYYAHKEKFRGKVVDFHESVVGKLFSEFTGHGHILNSKSQYNSFIVFRDFSNPDLKGTNSARVSLTSIAPTISHILFDEAIGSGVNLMPYMQKQLHFESYPIFSGTGLFLSAIMNPGNINMDELIDMAEKSYEVLDNGRVQLTGSAIKRLLKVREYGVFLNEWFLMKIRVGIEDRELYVLVNESTGEWTYDLDSGFAHEAPTGKLMALLAQRELLTWQGISSSWQNK